MILMSDEIEVNIKCDIGNRPECVHCLLIIGEMLATA